MSNNPSLAADKMRAGIKIDQQKACSMQVSNLLIGLGSIGIGVLLYIYSNTLPPIPGQIYGADVFPRFIAIGFMLCGIACTFLHNGTTGQTELKAPFSVRSAIRIVGLGSGIIAFAIVADRIGYLISCFLLLGGLMLAQKMRWWKAILAAALIAFGTYLIFAYPLRVPLPQFRLEF